MNQPVHEKRMRLAIGLARRNIRRGGGGPFGAAIFDLKTGRLLGRGVNRVVPGNDPTAHAEVMAIRDACRRRKEFSLKRVRIRAALYTSAEPCGMCCTALIWAGVSEVYCGARTIDVEVIGFDEGIKPCDWTRQLSKRSIKVKKDLLRKEAVEVLKEYRRTGGTIYNG